MVAEAGSVDVSPVGAATLWVFVVRALLFLLDVGVFANCCHSRRSSTAPNSRERLRSLGDHRIQQQFFSSSTSSTPQETRPPHP